MDDDTEVNANENSLSVSEPNPRQSEPRKKQFQVLLACSLLQLPIWGFTMTYGIFQEYYSSSNAPLQGSHKSAGVIGTTSNGVMYISMPFLFAAFSRKWAHHRRTAAVAGALITSASFIASSFSTNVWHLIVTQGLLVAVGSTLIYSPTTVTLGEWFSTSNRALAYGVVLASKNIVGTACPFLVQTLLDRFGFRTTLRIWSAIVGCTGLVAIYLIPSKTLPTIQHRRRRRIPWEFLKHQTFYIYGIATMLQSSGYGLPQTYLNTYAHDELSTSPSTATLALLLTLFNAPGILSSYFFGSLSGNNNRRFQLSATWTTCISALSSALSAFLLWGFASHHSIAPLLVFSMIYGFFAGGYSSTWGGVLAEIERTAAERNEAVDTDVLYGLLNGARGIGYVTGGLIGVPLLEAGKIGSSSNFGYGTRYGSLILFTGISTLLGGWSVLWKCGKLVHRIH